MEVFGAILNLIMIGLFLVNIYFIYNCKDDIKDIKLFSLWGFTSGIFLMYFLDECDDSLISDLVYFASIIWASLYTLKFKNIYKEKQPWLEKALLIQLALSGIGLLGSLAL